MLLLQVVVLAAAVPNTDRRLKHDIIEGRADIRPPFFCAPGMLRGEMSHHGCLMTGMLDCKQSVSRTLQVNSSVNCASFFPPRPGGGSLETWIILCSESSTAILAVAKAACFGSAPQPQPGTLCYSIHPAGCSPEIWAYQVRCRVQVLSMWEALSPAAMATLFRYIQIAAGTAPPTLLRQPSFLFYYPGLEPGSASGSLKLKKVLGCD